MFDDEWTKCEQEALRSDSYFTRLSSSLKLFDDSNEMLPLKGRYGNAT